MPASTNPFSDNTSIQITLHRNGNPNLDDQLAIRYKDDDYYQIFYRDGNQSRENIYCTVLSGEQVDTYIQALFTLLSRDTDPFINVQFYIPCFPTVIYRTSDLRKKEIQNALQQLLPMLTSAARF
jgi:hypothetical protein